MSLTIRTNNKPRFIIDAHELTEKQREEFDYLKWDEFDGWNGIRHNSAFSGLLIKLSRDGETVIVGQYFS